MNYLFFVITMFICIYAIKTKPGITLAYLLFFQRLNKLLFDAIELGELRYITTLLFLPMIYLLHDRKRVFNLNISNFKKNKITWGYILLAMYMVFYAFYIGTQYEMNFIKSFLFPGIIVFTVGPVFPNHPDLTLIQNYQAVNQKKVSIYKIFPVT